MPEVHTPRTSPFTAPAGIQSSPTSPYGHLLVARHGPTIPHSFPRSLSSPIPLLPPSLAPAHIFTSLSLCRVLPPPTCWLLPLPRRSLSSVRELHSPPAIAPSSRNKLQAGSHLPPPTRHYCACIDRRHTRSNLTAGTPRTVIFLWSG